MRGHESVPIKDYKGDSIRNSGENDPAGYFRSSLNVAFSHGEPRTRDGFALDLTPASVVRMQTYKRVGEVDRIIYLDSTGNLYDSNNPGVPILTIASMTDFSMISMFNRAYITPHNGESGLPGDFLYVYQGSGTARKAAGSPPATAPTAATSATSGDVSIGEHLFAIAFETDTGFVTKPGPAVLYTAPGSKKVDIAAIEVGPAGTVARYILGTRSLLSEYNGNARDYEFFFLPEGRIGNNDAGQTKTLNFFDTSLVVSADYLWESYEEVPAFLGVEDFNGSLIGWGKDGDESIIYISKSGNPETISEPYGYSIVRPGTGGGLKACTDFRGLIIAHKSQRTYAITPNNSDPNTWPIIDIDDGIGTEVHGIGQILDAKGHTSDRYVIADRAGLKLFVGTFAEMAISKNIEDQWARINFDVGNMLEVLVDPVNKVILIPCPLDDAEINTHVLYCDYEDGLTYDMVRWSVWTLPNTPSTMLFDVDTDNKTSICKLGSEDGNIYSKLQNFAMTTVTLSQQLCDSPTLSPRDLTVLKYVIGLELELVSRDSEL